MSDIKPFRQYDEHDVINLFTYADGTTSVDAGKLVKISTGWTTELDPVDLSGNASGSGLSLDGKALSTQWSVSAKVTASGATETPIGMTLVAMAETDENGEKLLYNPRKAAEMGVVIPGQAIPLATRGLFLYKSTDGTWSGVTAGTTLYAGASGEITTTSSGNVAVGVALGADDANGYALIKLDL
tara:strand:- start:8786 stop:9340 length:555 start_codon:yes stop_codon:yes gene_type:complete